MRRTKAETPLRELSIDLIDEPTLPMRETFDETGLTELAESIREMGVLQPVLVVEHDGRYRILDGHRRLIASMQARRPTIPAIVVGAADDAGEAVKCHANWCREDVNPGEEAVYLSHLLDRLCAGDVDRLCKLVRRGREYVEGRLVLLGGDPEVLAALKARRISLAVARELNKFADRGNRRMYLQAAVEGGATGRIIAEWRRKAEALAPADLPPPSEGVNQFSSLPAPVTSLVCTLCETSEDPWELELLYVHRRCRRLFLDRFLAQLHGEAPPPAPATQETGHAA